MRLQSHQLEVGGRTLSVRRAEPEHGTEAAVLFLHGAGAQARNFGSLMRRLPLRSAALDMPGHGRSPGPPFGTVEEAAGLALAVLRALWPPGAGVRRVIAGHSLGGAQALAAAANAEGSGEIEGLVLLGTGDRLELARRHAARAKADFEGFLEALRADGVPEVTVRQVAEAGQEAVAADLEAASLFSPLEYAPRTSVPSLLIGGDRDSVAPPQALFSLARALGGPSVIEILEGVGHLPMIEAPQAVAERIARFVSRCATM